MNSASGTSCSSIELGLHTVSESFHSRLSPAKTNNFLTRNRLITHISQPKSVHEPTANAKVISASESKWQLHYVNEKVEKPLKTYIHVHLLLVSKWHYNKPIAIFLNVTT